jgi:hypothetical protein
MNLWQVVVLVMSGYLASWLGRWVITGLRYIRESYDEVTWRLDPQVGVTHMKVDPAFKE